jgi:hypothetical protein
MVRKLLCRHKIRTQNEGVREKRSHMRSFTVGRRNVGELENAYNILKTEPHGNVKTMLVFIYKVNTAMGLRTIWWMKVQIRII